MRFFRPYRKDGMYVMGEEKVRTGEMDMEELTLRVMEYQKAKRIVPQVEALEDHPLDSIQHTAASIKQNW